MLFYFVSLIKKAGGLGSTGKSNAHLVSQPCLLRAVLLTPLFVIDR